MPEVTLRYNAQGEEVELLVDGEVAMSSGPEVFASWVEVYNESHPPAPPEPVEPPTPVEPPAPVEPAAPVEEKEVNATTQTDSPNPEQVGQAGDEETQQST